jgi:hypothetical protein
LVHILLMSEHTFFGQTVWEADLHHENRGIM